MSLRVRALLTLAVAFLSCDCAKQLARSTPGLKPSSPDRQLSIVPDRSSEPEAQAATATQGTLEREATPEYSARPTDAGVETDSAPKGTIWSIIMESKSTLDKRRSLEDGASFEEPAANTAERPRVIDMIGGGAACVLGVLAVRKRKRIGAAAGRS